MNKQPGIFTVIMYSIFRHTLFVRASRWFVVRCYRALKWHTGRCLKSHLGGDVPVVQSGPFKGMRYPDWRSVGSELEPKVIGTYEDELHSILEQIFTGDYSEVIDIGAAEGYYAVGLARRMEDIRCIAFEREAEGRMLCERMAVANDVADRVVVAGNCDKDSLFESITGRAFIVCDCEGGEYELLNIEDIPALVFCDMLIELHSHDDPQISEFEKIADMFDTSHTIRCINPRREKQLPPQLSLGKLNRYEREALLDENRSDNVGWVFLEAKKHA